MPQPASCALLLIAQCAAARVRDRLGRAGNSVDRHRDLEGVRNVAERIGSTLLEAALVEMRSRGYREAQLFTAAANRRSAIFYERRGWRATAINTARNDDLWLASYERFLVG